MRVAHRRRDPAIGDDAAGNQLLDPGFAQHLVEPRHIEGGIGDLLDLEVRGRKLANERVAPAAQREVTLTAAAL
jgi:hypothetical protein